MPIATAKVPASVVSGVVCLLLGIAGGVIIGGLTATPEKPVVSNPDDAKGQAAPAGGLPGGKGGPGGRMGEGPPAKALLTQLVGKLDLLTRKPALQLTPTQKQQMKALLADIDVKDEMSQEEAKTRLDALLKIIEEQKATVQAAGFAWPGAMAGLPTNTPPNPFKAGPVSQDVIHLKALLAALDAKD